jgi:hypothetical protein
VALDLPPKKLIVTILACHLVQRQFLNLRVQDCMSCVICRYFYLLIFFLLGLIDRFSARLAISCWYFLAVLWKSNIVCLAVCAQPAVLVCKLAHANINSKFKSQDLKSEGETSPDFQT